ncbi:hypothetical protein [Parasitella parasitica]|uniref:Uncharacterized protein n=1 Tax=Parasitella parasitica TaxID=35722 RepID=A0A0B7MPB3_9FUNG|nr:hypothetical protein [Parasitella parasitica]
MHPAALVAIISGGAFALWIGYEIANTIYEWHSDRKEQREYEEYVRMHNEKSQCTPVTIFKNDESDDDESDDDDEPLSIWKQKRSSLQASELRRRKNNIIAESDFSELEQSISKRKSLLEIENELLRKEEAELERSRELIRARGNSITGLVHDNTTEPDAGPFSDDFFVARSSPSPSLPADKSESSWSDLDDEKRSDSAESFESIHHNEL